VLTWRLENKKLGSCRGTARRFGSCKVAQLLGLPGDHISKTKPHIETPNALRGMMGKGNGEEVFPSQWTRSWGSAAPAENDNDLYALFIRKTTFGE